MDRGKNPEKRKSTENLLAGWLTKKKKTTEKSPTKVSGVQVGSITSSLQKISISPKVTTPTKQSSASSSNAENIKKKLNFTSTEQISNAGADAQNPSETWSFIKEHTRKTCVAEMRRAGLDESEKWKTKAILESNAPGYTYLWFKKSDWETIKNLPTIDAKMMIDTVLYVGVDVNVGRFEDHLSPFSIISPFDRHLKIALSNGEYFVAIYFGKKSNKNLLLESLMIARLKFVKAHQKAAVKLFNVQHSSLDKFMCNFNSNQFLCVLVSLFEDALMNGRVFESKDNHIAKARDYFAKVKILQDNRFEMFIHQVMDSLLMGNGELKCAAKMNDFTDCELDCFLDKMNCKIYKRKINGKRVTFIAKVNHASGSNDDVSDSDEDGNDTYNQSGSDAALASSSKEDTTEGASAILDDDSPIKTSVAKSKQTKQIVYSSDDSDFDI